MKYAVTFHAAMRYRYRVRNREVSIGAAGRELAQRMKTARVEAEPPSWIAWEEPADAWLFLDEDTVVVVQEDRAITVLTRAMADALVRRQCEQLGWVRESAAA